QLLSLVDQIDRDQALRELRRGLDRLPEARAQVRLEHEPVDDHLDRVLVLLVQDDLVFEQLLLAVDLHARETLAPQLLEDVLVLALAVAHDRCVDGEAGPLGHREDLVDDRLEALPGDRPAADGAVWAADPREEQAQVVIDLGNGADGRARVPRRRLLVDRDRRREPVDRVDVGLLHHLQELARVGGERLHVPPLPFGVDRVEGEARLARARQPGDADQLVPRQDDGDVFEVVLPRTVDDQLFCGHNRASLSSERVFVKGRFPPAGGGQPVPTAGVLPPTDDTRRPGEPPCTPARLSHAAAPTAPPGLPLRARGTRREGCGGGDENAAARGNRGAHLRLRAQVRGGAVPLGRVVPPQRLRLLGLRGVRVPALRCLAAALHVLAVRTGPVHLTTPPRTGRPRLLQRAEPRRPLRRP